MDVTPDRSLERFPQPPDASGVPALRGFQQRAGAVWTAIERACERDDFRPKPSRLCDFCSFRDYCPAWGGDPALARELVHSA